ncbi:thiamine-phosphate kinase [Allocoleopsis franciscana]|uniref:Thiamine-monophosphate kinase n=1 Tax=Allocoleopsis franciscana PCC 7113 TaxID=1173027 RepID=K9WBZ4_9CYAN|nr:thiamine-phosphate kinase [Allocoleopsis franciscana]AFZ17910.1 thiamine-phosphate kinase [Allocoleopsis franciscana PCC 7113]
MSSELSSLLVRDIGEQGLLERLQRFCPQDIVGDDAAVLPFPNSGQSLVVTTDVLVDGVHFSDRTTSPEDVGWRAAAANLSDLAAMGASPLGITVGLNVTGDTSVSWVEGVYQGLSDCLQQYNTQIVGGDVVRSPIVSLAITAFGQVSPSRIIRRNAANVGDAIIVTGVHGASRAGLELLLNPDFGKHLQNDERSHLIQAHQRPKPRLDVLPTLGKILDSPLPITLAGMDSSDGLADAVLQICRASGVGAELERTQILFPLVLHQFVTPDQAMNWALYGGEDFELVLCLPPEPAKTLVEQLGEGSAVIGTITTGKEVWLRDRADTFADERLTLNRGFQHF